ncbi:MAG: hypothetical protein P4L81_02115 [Candidatus Pacebacteria bacterium]|nr:hypothetical protein [Candidatus Paceibacterota bacterium]
MYSIDDKQLSSDLRHLRDQTVTGDGVEPSGINFLKSMLPELTDPDDRYRIYQYLLSELRIHSDFVGALEWAQKRLVEFGDIVSRDSVARALLELGRNLEALTEFRIAFRAAVESNKLVNFTFGEFMRAMVKVGDIETVNSVTREYFALKLPKSEADCALETDWLDVAEAQGAQRELIGELRRRKSSN